jgi:hypothetical protein
MQTHSRFDHKQQRYVMTDTRPPANPFEWRRYVVEEDIRRGGLPADIKVKKTYKPRKPKHDNGN